MIEFPDKDPLVHQRVPKVKLPQPEEWELDTEGTVGYFYSYHNIREYQLDQFIRGCNREHKPKQDTSQYGNWSRNVEA